MFENLEKERFSSGIGRLQGCFVLLPPSTKEMSSLDDYLKNMLSKGVGTVRIFPKSHRFSIDRVKELLKEARKGE